MKLEWKESSLVGITDETANKKYEYTYNADGLRTGKTVDGVKHEYYLSCSKILAETRESGGTKKLIKYYYDDTGVVGFNLDGTDYYFVKSMQGDVEKIYSASGELKAEYSYDSWGKCTIKQSVSGIAEANAFRYRGYYFDGESGLYYLNSRYYDPIIGRFISPDSLDYLDPSAVGGLNLYAYCGNNPIMYVDPEGKFLISSIVLTILLGFVLVYGVYAIYTIEKSTHCISNLMDNVGKFLYHVFESVGDFLENIRQCTKKFLEMFDNVLPVSTSVYLGYLDAYIGSIVLAEHTKNKRPSNRAKHEKGQAQRQREQRGGEKGDARRPYKKPKRTRLFIFWNTDDEEENGFYSWRFL